MYLSDQSASRSCSTGNRSTPDPGGILEGDAQSVDDTRNVTQDGQANVNEQVGTTSPLQEDTQWREDESKDDLADVAVRIEKRSACLELELATQATATSILGPRRMGWDRGPEPSLAGWRGLLTKR